MDLNGDQMIKKIVIIVDADEDLNWDNLREDLINTVEYHKAKPFTTGIEDNPKKCKKGKW